MTSPLKDIQSRFQGRLLQGGDEINSHLANGGPFMGAYDYAYRTRLIEILGEDFEGLHTLLGDEQFASAMTGYIDAYPSTTRSVRWLGRYLTDYLKSTQPWDDLPMLSSMAAFEWMLGLAFDAPDAPVTSVHDIGAVPPEAWPMLRISFHPALNTATLDFDVAPFYQDVKAETDPTGAPEPFDEPAIWAAWRDPEMMTVTYRSLEKDEAEALHAAFDGQAFDSICEVVASYADAENAAIRAAGLLRVWIESGWIIGFDAEGMSW